MRLTKEQIAQVTDRILNGSSYYANSYYFNADADAAEHERTMEPVTTLGSVLGVADKADWWAHGCPAAMTAAASMARFQPFTVWDLFLRATDNRFQQALRATPGDLERVEAATHIGAFLTGIDGDVDCLVSLIAAFTDDYSRYLTDQPEDNYTTLEEYTRYRVNAIYPDLFPYY